MDSPTLSDKSGDHRDAQRGGPWPHPGTNRHLHRENASRPRTCGSSAVHWRDRSPWGTGMVRLPTHRMSRARRWSRLLAEDRHRLICGGRFASPDRLGPDPRPRIRDGRFVAGQAEPSDRTAIRARGAAYIYRCRAEACVEPPPALQTGKIEIRETHRRRSNELRAGTAHCLY